MDDVPSQIDVGDPDFEREVVERSRSRPVVVDFWAPWCGPCRALTPLLEGLAADAEGAFLLAKVNVDEAPATAQRHGIRSIPTVQAYRDGRPVAEFQGAQPEPVVRRFVDALLPSHADRVAKEARELAAAGHRNAAEERFRAALAEEPRNPGALLGLAQLLAEIAEPGEEASEALELVDRVPPGAPELAEAERLAASLRTRSEAAGNEDELRARLTAQPGDLEARTSLGRLLAASDRHEEALSELLEAVKRDPEFADHAARKAILDVFELLGRDHPLTERFRAELARALFR